MSKKIVFIPEKIELEKILSEQPPSFRYRIDKFKYILNLLTLIPAYQKSDEETEYVPINAANLQAVIHDYKSYLQYLLDRKIIEADGKIIPNQKSNGFRFTEQYQSKVQVSYLSDARFCKILSKKYFPMQDENYQHLSKWFNDDLQIDYDAALAFNAQQFIEDSADNKQDESKWKALRGCNINHFSIEHLNQKDFRFKCDTTSKRIHSNLTICSSGLRKFLTYNKKTLLNSDLKCSQPFFLSLLLNIDFYSDKTANTINLKTIEEYSPRELKYKMQIQNGFKELITNTITLVNSKPDAENDIKKYVEEVEKGTFYEYFKALILKETGVEYERDAVKKIAYRVLYAHNSKKSKESREMCNLFRKCFPNVYSVIELLKQNNYKALPILMQSIESYIFIEKIAKRIATEYPDLPLYTIHDSILTLEEYKDDVAKIIGEEIFAATGLNPKLVFE